MKLLTSGTSVVETLLYKALRAPRGLVIRTPRQDQLIRKLYNVRSTQHIFKNLSIVKRFNNEIWLVKKEPSDGTPEA